MSSNSAFDDWAHDEKGALLMRKLAGLPDMRLGISWDILNRRLEFLPMEHAVFLHV